MGEKLFTCITTLLQYCYFLGYFPNCWKQDKRIIILHDNYHNPYFYRPILLSNIMGKIYEKIILQEAVKLLTENKFFDGKNVYPYQEKKKKMHFKPCFLYLSRCQSQLLVVNMGFLLWLT